jgi:hypothetical protein
VGKKRNNLQSSTPSLLSSLLLNVWPGAARRTAQRKRLFTRDIRISDAVRRFINEEARTRPEKEAFAELLLRLDADPTRHSHAILDPPIPGMRWALMGEFKVILRFDIPSNRIDIATVVL